MNYSITSAGAVTLLAVSALFLLGAVYVLLLHNTVAKYQKLATNTQVFVVSACLLVSVWCVRFMVGVSGAFGDDSLGVFEEAVNSIVHALQSFSMDEDYTTYVLLGKQLMTDLFGEVWAAAYGIYVSVLNIACPIAGGALLFSLISSIFPRVRLFFRSLAFWHPIYCFSKLNERSFALAKDIEAQSRQLGRPVIVFADVYEDDDDEAISELIGEAKKLGSICLKTDISSLFARRLCRVTYLLIDNDEVNNLEALAAFGDERRMRTLDSDDTVVFFCQSDSYVLVEKALEAKYKKLEIPQPRFVPVRSYSNMIRNLLVRHPLYDTLSRTPGEPLEVTVFGTGSIGTEMFLSTYWCGQILDHPLHINVVSLESEQDFRARIDGINPDILQTADPNSKLLDIYADGREKSEPYFKLRYRRLDITNANINAAMCDEFDDGFRLTDSNYILVALGSDQENLDVAGRIRRCVSANLLCHQDRRVDIAYIVYDEMLSKALGKTDDGNVRTFAVGSLDEVYSYSNVFMTGEYSSTADNIANVYERVILKKAHDSNSKRTKDDYTFWANLARAIHLGYEAFSAGADSYSEYADMVKSDSIDKKTLDRLAWLEHRRWCAFMCVQGFRCPTLEQEAAYIAKIGSSKNVDLKLHPCLVECSQNGINPDIFTSDPSGDDLLDAVTRRMNEHPEVGPYEYKKYDYPDIDLLREKMNK